MDQIIQITNKSRPLLGIAVGAWTFACVAGAGTAVAADTGPGVADINAACRIPFETLKDPKTGEPFPLSAAINASSKVPENLRQRYIVADLNSADAEGNCRGVQEVFTPLDELTDFPRLKAIAVALKTDLAALAKQSLDGLRAAERQLGSEGIADDAGLATELEELRNYLEQVHRYKTDPVVKPAVFNNYCVGQTLSFCEIVDGQPKLVFRFVTSSSRSVPPVNRYYAPINFINTRHWSSDRRYTPADVRRDARLGGGDGIPIPFANGGNPIEMPNFMNFLPMPGYTGETLNGIHEIAGGLDSGGTFGSPVSLGCIRLNKYQAKLARWWTPHSAKFFMYFEPHRYIHYGDASSGKARGFQLPGTRPNVSVAQNSSAGSYAPPAAESYAPPRNSMVEVQNGSGGGLPFLFPFFRNP